MDTLDKDALKEIADRLTSTPRLLWDHLNLEEQGLVETFNEGYKKFLDQAKTEREAVVEAERQADARGFVDLNSGQPGAKYFLNYRGKTAALAVLGQRPVSQGLKIVAAHIDSPRLDLKQNPLYEETDLVFLKTHYYGGIKKYQWLARPLALHGVIFKENGDVITLRLGEDPADPVFTVCDLLPHLARKIQMDKKVEEAFIGEKMNLLVGSLPLGDKETKERFKLHLLNLLYDRYGLREEDLICAELEAVPSGTARDIGWDRSLVGGYGQDDRAAAYPALQAILDLENPPCACLTLLVDKEEIGSAGNTSAQSVLLEELVAQLLDRQGESSSLRRRALMQSQAISADVAAGLDPDWSEVYEKRNAARLGYGVVLTKYTGHGGKYHANDAHAEYINQVRKIFNQNGVIWQAAGLGKIDEGGGGTIAKFLAAYGMDIVDCGPALLSMHSPFEIASKADIYMTYKAFRSFLMSAL